MLCFAISSQHELCYEACYLSCESMTLVTALPYEMTSSSGLRVNQPLAPLPK